MKLLLIAYHFPPDGEIGSVRPYQLARHLPEFGIDCTVLTVEASYAESLDPKYAPEQQPGVRILRTIVDRTMRDRVLTFWRAGGGDQQRAGAQEEGAHRDKAESQRPGRRRSALRQWALEWLSFPDLRYGWRSPASVAASRLLANERFDVIVSTSPPRVAHMVAADLSRRHRIPWIMDLRDPWYSSPTLPGRERRIQAVLQGRLYSRCAGYASVVVTNTRRLRADVTDGQPRARVVCIPNGFDPEVRPAADAPNAGPVRFSIGHFGQMVGHRTERPFLEGLQRWLESNPSAAGDTTVRFVGGGTAEARELCASLGISSTVAFEPRVPRGDVPKLMAQQYVLLLLANNQPLQIPGKAYEYLAAGRRVLAYAERDSATGDLLASAPGCFIAETAAEIARALSIFHGEFEAVADPHVARDDLLAALSYRCRARDYAALVYEVVGGNAR